MVKHIVPLLRWKIVLVHVSIVTVLELHREKLVPTAVQCTKSGINQAMGSKCEDIARTSRQISFVSAQYATQNCEVIPDLGRRSLFLRSNFARLQNVTNF